MEVVIEELSGEVSAAVEQQRPTGAFELVFSCCSVVIWMLLRFLREILVITPEFYDSAAVTPPVGLFLQYKGNIWHA